MEQGFCLAVAQRDTAASRPHPEASVQNASFCAFACASCLQLEEPNLCRSSQGLREREAQTKKARAMVTLGGPPPSAERGSSSGCLPLRGLSCLIRGVSH